MNLQNQEESSLYYPREEDVIKCVMKTYNISMSPLDVIRLTIKISADEVVSSLVVVFICCHDI